MDRRGFLAGAGLSLAALLAGCTEDDEASQESPENGDDTEKEFLEEGETPESPGAEAFLETVAEVTGGRTGFSRADDTWRIRFSEAGDTWTIEYYGEVVGSDEEFREEIAALATAFVSHRPDGVSLEATSAHVECTVGKWWVSAETAAAYDRGELDRETFIDTVYESVETENNC